MGLLWRWQPRTWIGLGLSVGVRQLKLHCAQGGSREPVTNYLGAKGGITDQAF